MSGQNRTSRTRTPSGEVSVSGTPHFGARTRVLAPHRGRSTTQGLDAVRPSRSRTPRPPGSKPRERSARRYARVASQKPVTPVPARATQWAPSGSNHDRAREPQKAMSRTTRATQMATASARRTGLSSDGSRSPTSFTRRTRAPESPGGGPHSAAGHRAPGQRGLPPASRWYARTRRSSACARPSPGPHRRPDTTVVYHSARS